MLEAQFKYEIFLHENDDEDHDDGTQFSFKIGSVTLGNSQSNTTVLVWICFDNDKRNSIQFNSIQCWCTCFALLWSQHKWMLNGNAISGQNALRRVTMETT